MSKKVHIKTCRCPFCQSQKPGWTPWNKGVKTGLIPNSAFKKGQTPWNKDKITGSFISKKGLIILSIKLRKIQLGKNNSNWRGGTNHLPYPFNWHFISLSVRKHDNNTCQLCGKFGDEVHHIDYNKENCKKRNLITLCDKCHGRTNGNRDYWFAYFTYIMDNR